MTPLVFVNVEVDGGACEVRIDDGVISAVGPRVPRNGAHLIDGKEGALLPGLHDHHVHLLAMAAHQASVDLSAVRVRADLRPALLAESSSTDEDWIRAVGYSDCGGPPLDRMDLDEIVSHRPVRIQHRSGGMWILNTKALRIVEHLLDESSAVERDEDGLPTGRLFRFDERLREALPDFSPDLGPVGDSLRRFGITRVTDATPGLEKAAIGLLRAAIDRGDLPSRITLLGAASTHALAPMRAGPFKLLLHDHNLPSLDELSDCIDGVHREGRSVAVHCVTRESLLLTTAALASTGTLPGDRIEHGAVVPPEVTATLRRLGIAVVTQPGFLYERGDDYMREVAVDDLQFLYPFGSLVAAGIPVCSSSDAPFGPLDPWQAIRTARDRRTASGKVLGSRERVPADIALNGYLRTSPAGQPRKVSPGSAADLVLLHTGLSEALQIASCDVVRATYWA